MSQNTSSAVMAQRIEPHDSLDFFPTPLWATRALCERLFPDGEDKHLSCWEPACGEGHMARALSESFAVVCASDVHEYGYGGVADFLWPDKSSADEFDWIITNPPFRLGMEFALTAIERARIGVAMLVRTAFLEGGERYDRLFKPHPPRYILQFSYRVAMFKGRLEEKGASATAYCWVVWTRGEPGMPTFGWLSSHRRKLEREGDWT